MFPGIEEQVRNIQAKKQALKENISEENGEKQRVGLGAGGHFDTDIYGSTRSKFEGYHTYIAPNEDAEVRSFESHDHTRSMAVKNADAVDTYR